MSSKEDNWIIRENKMGTSPNIANDCYSGMDNDIVLTTGYNFPDALSGSILAAKYNAPMILAGKENGVSEQKQYIDSTSIQNLYILGGLGAISKKTVDELTVPVQGS